MKITNTILIAILTTAIRFVSTFSPSEKIKSWINDHVNTYEYECEKSKLPNQTNCEFLNMLDAKALKIQEYKMLWYSKLTCVWCDLRFTQINSNITGHEVKIRGPDQGLGPIPSSKKWGSGTDPKAKKIMLWDQSLRLLVLWSQNSIS